MEGLKILYKYDGDPYIKLDSGWILISSKKFCKIRENDKIDLIKLRWESEKLELKEYWRFNI